MKNIKLSIALVAILLGLSGCVGGSWEGLVPGKSVHAKNVKHTVTTPWGHTETTIESIDTVIDEHGAVPATTK